MYPKIWLSEYTDTNIHYKCKSSETYCNNSLEYKMQKYWTNMAAYKKLCENLLSRANIFFIIQRSVKDESDRK